MSKKKQTNEQWVNKIKNSLDFRPDDNTFRVARDNFTDSELFDLEMELIFEKTWIFACHESQVAKPNDFFTMKAGRQPMIISRDSKGKIHALLNVCQHRGATLVRTCKGNQSTFTCPFHAWCYKSDGKLVKVKAEGEYSDDFDKSTRGLRKALIENYKGFIFINLDTECTESLEDFLGDAKMGFDMMAAQSPDGKLEVLPGASSYTYDGNWKLQNENGLDGYHVSTVHFNYVATVQHRQQQNASSSGEALKSLDYSKVGSGDTKTDDGWFAFNNGHTILFSDMPNPEVRPGYASVMPRLVTDYGEVRAKWIMHMLRNLNIYPSLLFMDQISSQLRVIRPVAWNKTEIHSFCLGVTDELDEHRESRIRQFEDFFNVSGMGTPDDLVEFREAQIGFEGRSEHWNDISRGCEDWTSDPTSHTKELGIKTTLNGTEMTHEGLYVNQHSTWQNYLLKGLSDKIKKEG